jgi:hypothetical protein
MMPPEVYLKARQAAPGCGWAMRFSFPVARLPAGRERSGGRRLLDAVRRQAKGPVVLSETEILGAPSKRPRMALWDYEPSWKDKNCSQS